MHDLSFLLLYVIGGHATQARGYVAPYFLIAAKFHNVSFCSNPGKHAGPTEMQDVALYVTIIHT